MNRSRMLALFAMIGVVAGPVLASAQHAIQSYPQIVDKAPVVLTLTAASPSNIGDGTPAVLQVSPVAPNIGVPTGNVVFTALQAGSITQQGVSSAPIALDPTSKAIWPQNLPVGNYQITASYGGDANFLPNQTAIGFVVIGPQDFSLTLDPGSLVVKQGSTWSGNLTATSINNFRGMVGLSCDGGGPKVFMTCLPGQPLMVTAAAPTAFPIQVTTTATVLKVVGSTGLLLLGLGLSRKQRRRRYQMCSVALLSLLVLAAGCGGVRYEQRDGTPKGDYKMTFVGQSGSLSHAVSLTITVQ